MRKSIELGVIPALLLGASLFVIGLLAANHILNNWWPFDVTRLDLVRDTALGRADAALILAAANTEIVTAFLATILMTVTGLALPLTAFLNKRFAGTRNPPFLASLRQAMWLGLWVAFCVWLQMNRSLGLAVAGLVAGVLIMFEVLLQVRSRAARITG